MTTKIDRLYAFLKDPDGEKGRKEGLNLVHDLAQKTEINPLSQTLRAADKCLLIMAVKPKTGEDFILSCTPEETPSDWVNQFNAQGSETENVRVGVAPCTQSNAQALMNALPNLTPVPLGMTPSFGFGDRTGLATPGHVKAMQTQASQLAPIFAQQSIREMERTDRTADQVMADAAWGAFRAGWQGKVGADADHLKTTADVDQMAAAGFTFFTIDPSDHVDRKADDYTEIQVNEIFQKMLDDKIDGVKDSLGLYADKSFDLGSAKVVLDKNSLKRAVVKYGRGLAHIYRMAEHIAKAMAQRGFELEISVDETEQPTSILEHLFIALELKRHGVPFISLAPRFIGDFEKGVDFIGDMDRFESDLYQHTAIAEIYGPYKISLHSGSDKFGVYPQLGKITQKAFHVKTAGTSYLEALRTACRVDPGLFKKILNFSRDRFETDRATYHISATLAGTPVPDSLPADELEPLYLDEDNGRQILHVTYGSVLTERQDGVQGPYLFRDAINTLLIQHRDLHDQLLSDHLGKHLRLLASGDK